MRNLLRRSFVAFVLASMMITLLAGVASAHITSKSIDTTTGACTDSTGDPGDPEPACGSAVYGANGFTGVITLDAVHSSDLKVVDYICVHTPSTGPFVSYTKGGMYTLTLFNDGGTVLASATYTVIGGVECTSGTNAVEGGTASGATIPANHADTTIKYGVTIQGVTPESAPTDFPTCASGEQEDCYNSIRNRALDSHGGHADSPSVKPPTTPPGEIPEAPVSALLVLTAGVGAAWFVGRRMRSSDVALPA